MIKQFNMSEENLLQILSDVWNREISADDALDKITSLECCGNLERRTHDGRRTRNVVDDFLKGVRQGVEED